ncbi:Trithorax group protein osa, partial [Fragariocoptes setiger]
LQPPPQQHYQPSQMHYQPTQPHQPHYQPPQMHYQSPQQHYQSSPQPHQQHYQPPPPPPPQQHHGLPSQQMHQPPQQPHYGQPQQHLQPPPQQHYQPSQMHYQPTQPHQPHYQPPQMHYQSPQQHYQSNPQLHQQHYQPPPPPPPQQHHGIPSQQMHQPPQQSSYGQPQQHLQPPPQQHYQPSQMHYQPTQPHQPHYQPPQMHYQSPQQHYQSNPQPHQQHYQPPPPPPPQQHHARPPPPPPAQPQMHHQSPVHPPQQQQPVPIPQANARPPMQHTQIPPQHHPPAGPHPAPQTQAMSQTPPPVAPPPPASVPQAPSSAPSPQTQAPKREISFPPGCVEATKPVTLKRRRLTSKDVSSIEAWRLLMCLKSGLLAEASWAIDVLGILLNDDSTVMHFGLQHLPGLLDALLGHYKRCLEEIFDNPCETDDHADLNANKVNITSIKVNGFIDDQHDIPTKVTKYQKMCNSHVSIPRVADQIIMFSSTKNYTYRTRDGKIVKLEPGVPPIFDGKDNDTCQNDSESSSKMTGANTEDLSYIQIHFEPKKSSSERWNSKLLVPSVKVKLEETQSEEFPRVRPSDIEAYKLKSSKNEMEDEADAKGEHLMNPVEDYQLTLARRCICLSTLFRNLSFVPGNETEMSKHHGLLSVLGRLLLLKHEHKPRNHTPDFETSTDVSDSRHKASTESDELEWYRGMLHLVRENTLVTISNLSSSLDLTPLDDDVTLSMLEGLLHWSVCSSSYALDPFSSGSVIVSPQRLAFESLAKLSIIEGNVDLILATPPWSRIEKLFAVLSRSLSKDEDQTVRELALVLLSNLASAGSSVARTIALTGSVITQLISFIESAEATTQEVVQTTGPEALRDPEVSGTTQDMLRRAAHTLRCISQLSENHPLFSQHQERLLSLVMSNILDPGVVQIIADEIIKEMRRLDDLIIHKLNETVPRGSQGRNVQDHSALCLELYGQLKKNFSKRDQAINYCLSDAETSVETLRSQMNGKPEDSVDPAERKKFRAEKQRLRFIRVELGSEESIRERTLKVLSERCRQYGEF